MSKLEKKTYHHNTKEREDYVHALFVKYHRGIIGMKKIEDTLTYYVTHLYGGEKNGTDK